jgi:hypothetical protein
MQVTVSTKMRAPVTARGIELPPEATARFEYPDDHTVEIDIAVEGDDVVCNAVRITRRKGGPSLSGIELRRLPLTRLVTIAVGMIATREGRVTDDVSVAEEAEGAFKRPRRRRDSVTDERLHEVARIVRENAEPGVAPWRILHDFGHVGRSQAYRLLDLCVEGGILDPSEAKVKA